MESHSDVLLLHYVPSAQLIISTCCEVTMTVQYQDGRLCDSSWYYLFFPSYSWLHRGLGRDPNDLVQDCPCHLVCVRQRKQNSAEQTIWGLHAALQPSGWVSLSSKEMWRNGVCLAQIMNSILCYVVNSWLTLPRASLLNCFPDSNPPLERHLTPHWRTISEKPSPLVLCPIPSLVNLPGLGTLLS